MWLTAHWDPSGETWSQQERPKASDLPISARADKSQPIHRCARHEKRSVGGAEMAVRHHVHGSANGPQHTAQLRKLDEATGGTRVMHALLSAQRDPALGDAHVVLSVHRSKKSQGLEKRGDILQREAKRSEFLRVEMHLVVGGVAVVLDDCSA